ncbi:MAG: hypothetical protein HON90_02245 [Halobacteriovoraceae bacterium]|jgi:hypothetical protein|nr:hypothetical protein [Halobacteriovoraceae bacterium]
MKKLLILLLFIFSQQTLAAAERSLGKSARGLLMGDAYTSIADDEYTLFYNPAILARHKGFSFYPLNPAFSGTNILSEPDRFTDLGSEPTDFATAAFDFPVHIGINYAPGFKMGKFGLTALVNYNSNFNLQNQVTPMLDVDHHFDRGFIAGYAHPLFGSYTTGSGGEHLALGLSVKYIQREAIYGSYNLTGYSLLDALSKSDADAILESLGKINGSGWGADIGLDYINSSGAQTFSAGLAILDLYTILHTESNTDDLEVQTQPIQVNLGTAWQVSAGAGFGFTVSADIKHLEQQMELARRVHLGLELELTPALSLLGGINAVDNYSYGLKFNTGLIKIYAGFYGTEIGEKLHQQDSDRFIVYLSLFHFTFNP